MKNVCVNCGSKPGVKPEYQEAAQRLGEYLAINGIGLVYGGGNVGLMGILAHSCISRGGKVTGVIPERIYARVPHLELSELHIVKTMHERKRMMADLSDAFIALPGGYGTFEEIFEAVAWLQLGYHDKPCAIFNVCGYYDRLIDFLAHSLREGFLKPEHHDMLIVSDDLEEIFDRCYQFRHSEVGKW